MIEQPTDADGTPRVAGEPDTHDDTTHAMVTDAEVDPPTGHAATHGSEEAAVSADSGSSVPAGASGDAEHVAVDEQASASGRFAATDHPWSAAGDEAVRAQEPPDLTADTELDSALEAVLLVVDVPAGEQLLAETLRQPVQRVRTALYRLSDRYAAEERGIDLRRVGDGWRMYTRELYAPYVERYLLDGQRSKLTRAALETLAVIAYRQPVTRARVAAVRGVNVDGVIRTLVGRGLVEEAGTDPESGGLLYCTTELFLERLGLSSLKDLPPLAPLLPEVDAIDDV